MRKDVGFLDGKSFFFIAKKGSRLDCIDFFYFFMGFLFLGYVWRRGGKRIGFGFKGINFSVFFIEFLVSFLNLFICSDNLFFIKVIGIR